MTAKGVHKTHCPKGHAYDEENTYVSPKGDRLCRTCQRDAQRARRVTQTRDQREYLRAYRATPEAKRKRWERDLLRRYGLTVEEYEILLVLQEGKCAGCRQEPVEGTLLHVDHDHQTGIVRGLLCHSCNRGLGLLKDEVAVLIRLAMYLEPDTEKLLDVLRAGEIPGVRLDALREAG